MSKILVFVKNFSENSENSYENRKIGNYFSCHPMPEANTFHLSYYTIISDTYNSLNRAKVIYLRKKKNRENGWKIACRFAPLKDKKSDFFVNCVE